MGRPPGKKPKPSKLKILGGNAGKRKVNLNEPQPSSEVPLCPDWIEGEAKKEWTRIVKELDEMGLLTNYDHAHIEAYCVAYGRWVEAEQIIKEKGTLYMAKSGYPMPSPYLVIANKALEQMYKIGTEFGMTPSSRSRINVEKKKADSDFDEFMKKKKK